MKITTSVKIIASLLIASCLLTITSGAQTRFTVSLKNKGGTPYSFSSPLAYLSQRAIDRRTRYGIAIDSADLPVTPAYITQIRNVPNVTVLATSRWLNQVCIQTSDPNAITTITAFPFVQSTKAVGARTAAGSGKFRGEENIPYTSSNREMRVQADYFNYGTSSFNEIHLHKGEFLHNIGLRGQGMQIAMLDAGYFNYTTLKAFDSVNINGQVLSTWDFVENNASVVEDYFHGMECFSTIAANIPGEFIGKAPKASFHLFRTENVTGEYPIEEFYWVCGAERADSTGADILSSSLGYFDFDDPVYTYTYANMDGRTTIAVKGAAVAVRKGLIVLSAIGNTGNSPDPALRFLTTPSDGDSVLAVGAVNVNGEVWPGSSYGPAPDGRIKPDVASVGFIAMKQNTGNTIGFGNGTSYATPNMAGLSTCLWQGFPEFNNMRIITAIKKSGSVYTAPNNRIGYGVPDMKKAFSDLLIQYATSTVAVTDCNATVSWISKDVRAMKYEIERKAPADPAFVKVGELNPQAGTVLANRSYTFTNALSGVAAGTVAYRIRQIIDTAAASFTAVYIDTATVTLASSCATTGTNDPDPDAALISIRPNPVVTGNATLVIQTNYAITHMPVMLYDMKGRLLYQVKSSKASGKKELEIPAQQLPAGEYIIKVLNGTKTAGTVKMIRR